MRHLWFAWSFEALLAIVAKLQVCVYILGKVEANCEPYQTESGTSDVFYKLKTFFPRSESEAKLAPMNLNYFDKCFKVFISLVLVRARGKGNVEQARSTLLNFSFLIDREGSDQDPFSRESPFKSLNHSRLKEKRF